jgi:hypothetical protein
LGSGPISVSADAGLPVVVTLNAPFEPTPNVVLVALLIWGGVFTVTVVVAVTDAGVVAELVTVSV